MDLLSEFHEISNQFEAWFYFVVFILTGSVMGIIIFILTNTDKGYKQGQIDALNGKVKYEKKENEDKEIVWEEIIKPK